MPGARRVTDDVSSGIRGARRDSHSGTTRVAPHNLSKNTKHQFCQSTFTVLYDPRETPNSSSPAAPLPAARAGLSPPPSTRERCAVRLQDVQPVRTSAGTRSSKSHTRRFAFYQNVNSPFAKKNRLTIALRIPSHPTFLPSRRPPTGSESARSLRLLYARHTSTVRCDCSTYTTGRFARTREP
jgi:hypothetical protein